MEKFRSRGEERERGRGAKIRGRYLSGAGEEEREKRGCDHVKDG